MTSPKFISLTCCQQQNGETWPCGMPFLALKENGPQHSLSLLPLLPPLAWPAGSLPLLVPSRLCTPLSSNTPTLLLNTYSHGHQSSSLSPHPRCDPIFPSPCFYFPGKTSTLSPASSHLQKPSSYHPQAARSANPVFHLPKHHQISP